MSAPPRVTACMPAWNAAAFITPVLASLAAQRYAHLRVLIAVDACDDGTAALCAAFAAEHTNVTAIRRPTRLGWIGNANALLRAVDGDYAFFAFHDDPLEPDYVARLVDALEARPDAVLAFSDVASNLGPFCYDRLDGVADRVERARHLLLQQGPWWVPNRGLMRVAAVKRLGGMRRHLAGESGADLPWLLRLALLGAFVRVPEPLVRKTFRHNGLAAGWRRDAWRRIALELACASAVCGADLTPAEKVRLCGAAASFALRQEAWTLRERLRAHSSTAK